MGSRLTTLWLINLRSMTCMSSLYLYKPNELEALVLNRYGRGFVQSTKILDSLAGINMVAVNVQRIHPTMLCAIHF